MAANGLDHYLGSFANDAAANALLAANSWTAFHGLLYYDSTLSALKFWNGTAWVLWQAWEAFPGIELEQVLFVDEGSNAAGSADGSAAKPYQTIAAAYAQAKTLAPAVGNPVTLYVFGGVYDEFLVLDTSYINIVGIGKGSTIITNTTAGKDTITVDTGVVVRISFCTIINTIASYAAITQSNNGMFLYLDDCIVRAVGNAAAGAPVYLDQTGTLNSEQCDFISDTDDGYNFYLHSASLLLKFRQCRFYGGSVNSTVFYMTSATTNIEAYFEDCEFRSPDSNLSGYVYSDTRSGNITFRECLWSMGNMNVKRGIYTSGDSAFTLNVVNCTFISACIVLGAAGMVLKAIGNLFTVSSNSYDIEAQPAAGLTTPALVTGNEMYKGMNYKCKIKSPIKRVCTFEQSWGDCYKSFDDAVQSVWEDDAVILLEDDVAVAGINPPAYKMEVDGQGQFGVYRAAGQEMFSMAKACDLTLRGVVNMVGIININHADAKLRLVDQCKLTGCIYITTGTLVSVEDSTIVGDSSSKYCIDINNNAPPVYVMRSYLKGYTGEPAIDNPSDNPYIKVSWSTLINGGSVEPPADSPIIAAGEEVPFSSHHNAYNTDPAGGGMLNNIGTPYDVFDTDADWGWGA